MSKKSKQERLKKIKEKIKILQDEKAKVLKRKGKAAQMGDIYENAAFELARQKVWLLDSQIASLREELEEIVKNV